MRSNAAVRKSILGDRHGDINYLMQDQIGVVISRGLTATYEQRPKNPIEYFARWMLNFRETQRAAQAVSFIFAIIYLTLVCL